MSSYTPPNLSIDLFQGTPCGNFAGDQEYDERSRKPQNHFNGTSRKGSLSPMIKCIFIQWTDYHRRRGERSSMRSQEKFPTWMLMRKTTCSRSKISKPVGKWRRRSMGFFESFYNYTIRATILLDDSISSICAYMRTMYLVSVENNHPRTRTQS